MRSSLTAKSSHVCDGSAPTLVPIRPQPSSVTPASSGRRTGRSRRRGSRARGSPRSPGLRASGRTDRGAAAAMPPPASRRPSATVSSENPASRAVSSSGAGTDRRPARGLELRLPHAHGAEIDVVGAVGDRRSCLLVEPDVASSSPTRARRACRAAVSGAEEQLEDSRHQRVEVVRARASLDHWPPRTHRPHRAMWDELDDGLATTKAMTTRSPSLRQLDELREPRLRLVHVDLEHLAKTS